MSLYDDLDTIKTKTTEKVAGWSSGIKLLQSQLQLKKAATTAPKRDQIRKASLAPVIDLKSKKDDDIYPNLKPSTSTTSTFSVVVEREPPQFPIIPAVSVLPSDYDWDVIGEYDPLWPNEYDKVVKELREQRERENEKQQDERDKKQRDRRRKSRFSENEEPMPPPTPQISTPALSGFAGRWDADDEEPVQESPKPTRPGGVAIAPPPSLQEIVPEPPAPTTPPPASSGNTYGASSIAARIMAKYGFKEGQGLGKKEQGMAMALQVEKTSKRGGRIIHEKEIMPPPPPALGSPVLGQISEFAPKPEPSITEIMRSPSKIVLLRNMVGPGEVDEELEPEVKDECNTKYGDVIKVVINEIESLPADEAVRIFVEFKRIESAIKAVVDLNGRFFGGRTVKAGFYDVERFAAMQLMDGL